MVRERDLPGAGIIGGENDAPFPEGLPALHSSACDLDCAQEWYGYFDDRASALWVNSLSDPSLKSAADSMLAMETAAERQVEAQGGIPGEEAPTPVERPTASGTRSAPSGGSSGAQSPPSEPSTKGADDSKKDDGPPVGWALGEFDSSEIVDGLMFATGGVLVQAASEAYHGNSSSTACNKKTPEEKATAAACPK